MLLESGQNEEPETRSSSSAPASSSVSDQQSSSTSPPATNLNQPQVPAFAGFAGFGNGETGMLPVMYPVAFSGLNQRENQQQTNNRGRGIYAVPVHPYSGIPSNTLIPLTYSIPTTRPSMEAGAVGSEHGQAGQEQQQAAQQRHVVVRRFEIAIHLDLLLILKLAAVIFMFSHDGSRLRLSVLVFFASLIYLYQTGALTPLFRWLTQSMQRAAQPPRPAVRADNVPAAARQGNDVAEGQAGADNENQPLNDGNQAVGDENAVEPGANGGNQWWGIVKEIQMIVFGFITSLLPGFHNID